MFGMINSAMNHCPKIYFWIFLGLNLASTFSDSLPCEDYVAIKKPIESTRLQQRYEFLDHIGTLMLFQSQEFNEAFLKLSKIRIKGHETWGLNDLVDSLFQKGCSLYLFGGAVRDMLNTPDLLPTEVDFGTNCDAKRVAGLCRKYFGAHSCVHWREYGVVQIRGRSNDWGDRNLDVDIREVTADNKINDDFTVNGMIFDLQTLLLIDKDGGGRLEDICARKIRIPKEFPDWEKWAKRKVIVRYWKLVLKGYESGSSAEEMFIHDKARKIIARNTNIAWPLCLFVDEKRLQKSANLSKCSKPPRRSKRSVQLYDKQTGNGMDSSSTCPSSSEFFGLLKLNNSWSDSRKELRLVVQDAMGLSQLVKEEERECWVITAELSDHPGALIVAKPSANALRDEVLTAGELALALTKNATAYSIHQPNLNSGTHACLLRCIILRKTPLVLVSDPFLYRSYDPPPQLESGEDEFFRSISREKRSIAQRTIRPLLNFSSFAIRNVRFFAIEDQLAPTQSILLRFQPPLKFYESPSHYQLFCTGSDGEKVLSSRLDFLAYRHIVTERKRSEMVGLTCSLVLVGKEGFEVGTQISLPASPKPQPKLLLGTPEDTMGRYSLQLMDTILWTGKAFKQRVVPLKSSVSYFRNGMLTHHSESLACLDWIVPQWFTFEVCQNQSNATCVWKELAPLEEVSIDEPKQLIRVIGTDQGRIGSIVCNPLSSRIIWTEESSHGSFSIWSMNYDATTGGLPEIVWPPSSTMNSTFIQVTNPNIRLDWTISNNRSLLSNDLLIMSNSSVYRISKDEKHFDKLFDIPLTVDSLGISDGKFDMDFFNFYWTNGTEIYTYNLEDMTWSHHAQYFTELTVVNENDLLTVAGHPAYLGTSKKLNAISVFMAYAPYFARPIPFLICIRNRIINVTNIEVIRDRTIQITMEFPCIRRSNCRAPCASVRYTIHLKLKGCADGRTEMVASGISFRERVTHTLGVHCSILIGIRVFGDHPHMGGNETALIPTYMELNLDVKINRKSWLRLVLVLVVAILFWLLFSLLLGLCLRSRSHYKWVLRRIRWAEISVNHTAVGELQMAGKGHFANVWEAKYKGNSVVVKVPRIQLSSEVLLILRRFLEPNLLAHFKNGGKILNQFKRTLSRENVEAFLEEAIIHARLQDHPGILQVYGIVMDVDPPRLIFEKMDETLSSSLHKIDSVRVRNLLKISLQVAKACRHIESKSYAHLDISGRNILCRKEFGPTGFGLRVKLSDFGLAKETKPQSVAQRGRPLSAHVLPKSSAPELIDPKHPEYQTVTTKSDSYLFGNLLVEIFTLGKGLSDSSMFDDESAGRMGIPTGICSLIHQCSSYETFFRPNFQQIIQKIEKIHESRDYARQFVSYPVGFEPTRDNPIVFQWETPSSAATLETDSDYTEEAASEDPHVPGDLGSESDRYSPSITVDTALNTPYFSTDWTLKS